MIEALRRVFTRQGHIVRIITTLSFGEKVRARDSSITYLKHQSSKNQWKNRLKRLCFFGINRKILNDLLKNFDPDLCNLHIGPLIDDAFQFIIPTNVPLVVTLQSIYQKEVFSHRLEKLYIQKLLSSASMITVVSRGVFNTVQDHFVGFPVKVIPNGVDLLPHDQNQCVRKKQGVFIGRLSREKGCDILLKAAVHVPDLRLIIVGEGPESAILREFARINQLRNVIFTGAMDNQGARSLMRESQFLVLPSRYEGFPLTVLEAMNEGCPVIASDLPGTRDAIYHGVDGLLVPPGDDRALAAAILKILGDERLRGAIREAALKKVKNQFSIQTIADQYLETYRLLSQNMNHKN